MNRVQLKTLMWKDWRQNSRLALTAVIFLLLPYVLIPSLGLVQRLTYGRTGFFSWQEARHVWGEVLNAAGGVGMAIAVLLAGFFAGNAIAGERADRSAEFVAYLPVPRRLALISKLAVATLASVVMLGVNFIPYMISSALLPSGSTEELGGVAAFSSLTALLIFGVAWLLSSALSSPTMAAAAGVLTPLVLVVSMKFVSDMTRTGAYQGFDWPIRYCVLAGISGLACLLAGSWHYLRRYSP